MSNLHYAGFWRRFWACMIDRMIMFIVSLVAAIPVALIYLKIKTGVDLNIVIPDIIEAWIFLVYTILHIFINWLYHARMESSVKQATYGKAFVGIIVTDAYGNKISFGRATLRHFAKIISAIILYFGFWMVGFTKKKQALHDKIADCLLVRKF